MKSLKSLAPLLLVITIFLGMAVASVPSTHTYNTYSKPKPQPCVQHAPITYSPILVKISVGANYTLKDPDAIRSSHPEYIMETLHSYNSSYKLADGVTPNLNLMITYTNDGYDHYGVNLNVNYQGEGNFTITLPTNYVSITTLINDMVKELNRWVTNGWHEGDCTTPINNTTTKKKKKN